MREPGARFPILPALRLLAAVVVVSACAQEQEVTAVEADRASVQSDAIENGYYSFRVEPGAILSMRLDAQGRGDYGTELVAAGQKITGVTQVQADGPRLMISVGAEGLAWPLPFLRSGFYDADRHLNYGDPEHLDNVTPLALPVRKFVSSTGQTLFIEYFKRLPLGPHGIWLNLLNGSRFWIFGDRGFGGHAGFHCPGQSALLYEVGEDYLRFRTKSGPSTVEMELFPTEDDVRASFSFAQPAIRFEPEFEVTNDLVGKTVQAGPLATDMLQMAILWHPDMMLNGEWILDAVRTHWFGTSPSTYHAHLRDGLLRNLALIGYDRYEHFGMLFNWGQYPDYGAGGLLNVPENNGKYDMRMLHVNAMYIIAVAEYILTTGDISLLKAQPSRWVGTDGQEPQPVSGGKASTLNYVLAAGDRRLDGRIPQKTFYLGQTFTASAPFQSITLRLGSPVTNGADVYENKAETDARVEVFDAASGRLVTQQTVSVKTRHDDQKVTLTLAEQARPGRYEVRLSDPRSGVRYFGPVIGWWTEPESTYQGGEATWGPARGGVYDRLKTLFDYLHDYTGVATENLSYYPNDPNLNVPDQKSGRPGVTMQNSYHECLGGGYDAFMGLWWPPACDAMAQLAGLMGDEALVERCRALRRAGDEAYNRQYWHTVTENGKTFARYYGCKDWDGRIHDYGFTYYNAEAAQFRIPSREQAWEIFRWLDRGYWKPRPDAPWHEDIYGPWQIAAPFNTIEIGDWVGITGKLPYFEVLSNGGTRLMYEARALAGRHAYLSIDNAHERNEQVLARFASPDRLTGGRSFDDPGGRGRWHFGPPYVDRADIEGYREIFPGNGSLGSSQIALYLGSTFETDGLRLAPEVPSALESVELSGIGFRGHTFDLAVRAIRDEVPMRSESTEQDGRGWAFTASRAFNKVGVQIVSDARDVPYRGGIKATLVLEAMADDGSFRVIAKDWRSHLRHGEWIWVRCRERLQPEQRYRLRLEELDETAQLAPESLDAPRLVLESTALRVTLKHSTSGAGKPKLVLSGGIVKPLGFEAVEAILQPGEHAMITAPWVSPAQETTSDTR